jgi:hypothetical protein
MGSTAGLIGMNSKDLVGSPFVDEEFGTNGQLRTTTFTLRSLFDPSQNRLDRDYWQRTLRELLDEAPPTWHPFAQTLRDRHWSLRVDGMVYVHQYNLRDERLVATRAADLGNRVHALLSDADNIYFGLGMAHNRLRLVSYPLIERLLRTS